MKDTVQTYTDIKTGSIRNIPRGKLEQRKMRTNELFVTSVVPAMADGPMLPSYLGRGGGGKLKKSRCVVRGGAK